MATQIINGDGVARVSALKCIDLWSFDTRQSVSLLKQACLDCWFFYLVNHGISEELMAEVDKGGDEICTEMENTEETMEEKNDIADIIVFLEIRYFFNYPNDFRQNIGILSIISRYFQNYR
ncbi:unnamed protein product [Malus baccata var. baccata]